MLFNKFRHLVKSITEAWSDLIVKTNDIMQKDCSHLPEISKIN